MKKLIITFLIIFIVGCGGKIIQTLSKGCDWLDKYQSQAQTAIAVIQAQYDAKITQGNKAWLSAADLALAVLGAVVQGTCKEISEIENSLNTVNNTLPKIVADQKKIEQLTQENKALQARNENLNQTLRMIRAK